MALAERLDDAYLLVLPEDLLNIVGSWLDDQDLCNMERASKEIHHVLSSPSRPGPGKRRLDLGARFDGLRPPSKEASRLPAQSPPICNVLVHGVAAMLACRYPLLYVRCHGSPMASCHRVTPCRWLQKRVRRYSHIVCAFRTLDSILEEINEGIATCIVPPLLPSLLAGCAPTAGLSLSLGLADGEPARATDCQKSIFQCDTEMAMGLVNCA